MAKSFRKFREDSYGDWDDQDNDIREKHKKMESRRDQRRKKLSEQQSVNDTDEQ
jgi:hypothetical protein